MSEQEKAVLAIDTAAMGGISVGVMAGGKTATRIMETQRDQASFLVPLIQETLEEAGASFKEFKVNCEHNRPWIVHWIADWPQHGA